MRYIADTIMMIRPKNFGSNPETLEDNVFQAADGNTGTINETACKEFDNMVSLLMDAGIEVMVIDDTDRPKKPDAIFPNNWLVTDPKGSIYTFSMYSPLRRKERREDIIESLLSGINYKKRYGFEYLEDSNEFLEGTGSMVLDRANNKLYASLSNRTHIQVLDKFAILTGMEKVIFNSSHYGKPVYHTNVLMGIGEEIVVLCSDAIASDHERNEVIRSLEADRKTIIDISIRQMEHYAGNIIQLISKNGSKHLVLSETAFSSLSSNQIDSLSKNNHLLVIPIPTIEKYGGGSVRCMITELF